MTERHADPKLGDIDDVAAAVRGRDRRALSRAITLVESTRGDDRADRLLSALSPHTGGALRVGISGPPGVGKSTLIEAAGIHIVEQGHRLAVLAVDPSSQVTGGAILADKTRMTRLAGDARAFIRPSPAGDTTGGVARRTREALLVCEAAGFDVVIVETVGVGQSEAAVADMVDMFVLLLAPAGGDELQGIKRGVLELADLVCVTKADGEWKDAAGRAEAALAGVLGLLRPRHPGWRTRATTVSAFDPTSVAAWWHQVEAFDAATAGARAERRRDQARAWLWREIDEGLRQAFRADAEVARLARDMEARVAAGEEMPHRAAARLFAAFRGG